LDDIPFMVLGSLNSFAAIIMINDVYII